MAKLQSTENVSREMQQQSTEMLSHKRLCKRNRLFSGAWRTQQRRGVLLLVSLVLLVMFLMLGVTFVLTAGNFRRSSEAYQRMLERPSADLPERSGDLLDSVAHDLVRGTSNKASPFAEENLLEDLYGRPALRGMLTSVSTSQLTDLEITADADFTLSTVQDYYAGLVLTMLTGNLKGTSTRIVGWDGSSKLKVVDFSGAESPATDDLFLVNGRPFSGDGSDTSGRRLNEDYDVADANNPWLFSRDASGEITSDTASFAKQTDWNADCRPVTITHDDGSTTQVVVDNDGDGEKDSVWIDAGLPLQLQPDGTYVKPLVAMMVRDLDGRVNLNAHGSMEEMRDSQDTMGTGRLGLGYGPAEIDPKFIFFPEDTYTSEHVRKIENFVCRRRNAELSMPPPPSGADGGGSYDTSEYDSSDSSDPEYLIEATASDALNDFLQFGSAPQDLITPIDPHGLTQVDDSLKNSDGSINLQQMYIPDAGHSKALEGDFGTNPYGKQLDTADDIVHSHDPYTPEQLESVLRFADADADSIDPRLAHDLAPLGITGPDQLKMIRDLITTESWDLPVAGLAWPQGLSGQLTDTPTAGHITDLFAARFKKEDSSITDDVVARQRAAALMVQLDPSNPFDDHDNDPQTPPRPQYEDADGNLIDQTEDDWEEKIVRRGLISPGLTRGTRFNVNRLFGNGVDDNGNQVVDEPGEAGNEPITAPGFDGVPFDHDGNGTPGQANDKHARQHYAQQLYLMLMLLADGLESDSAIGSQENLARRLAQFAVNAVDYRDADSIMTPFEYDAQPFDADGWLSHADGNLSNPNNPPSDPNYGVVWGCESPALAITETLALHDRRTRDKETDWDGDTMQDTLDDDGNPVIGDDGNPEQEPAVNKNHDTTTPDPDDALTMSDKDFDQYAVPQGSLFIELQRIANHGFAADGSFKGPQDIYDASGDLHLSKRVTRPADAQFRSGEQDPVWRMAVTEPHGDGSGKVSPFDQLVPGDRNWSPSPSENRVFNPAVTFEPDDPFSDLDVASNENPIERYIFFHSEPSTSSPEAGKYYNRSGSEIKLKKSEYLTVAPRDETPLGWKTDGTTRNDNGPVSIPTGLDASGRNRHKMICGIDVPTGWTNANNSRSHIGLSVSEPLRDNYYEENSSNIVSISNDEDKYNIARDRPFDHPAALPGSPISGLNLLEGTVEDYCTVFLQRLANPLLPHNPLPGKTGHDQNLEVNPYLTLDLMPIDLTIFNGDSEENSFDVNSGNGTDATEPIYATSRQRGYGSVGRSILWPVADPLSGHDAGDIDVTSYFGHKINSGLNTSTSENLEVSPEHVFWPDRPFVSQYELLMVPASEPGKLALEMGTHKDSPDTNFSAGFPHLLNFFFQSSSEPQLGRVFDYLHVPSKFAGTQVSLDPGSLSEVPGFAPPFNVVSTYREPGRVNLNTIEDSEVWKAVMHGEPSAADPKSHQGPAHSSLQDTYHGPGEVSGVDGESVAMPLLSSSLGFEGTDTNSPFLRYQPINRMGNLTTTRSNVYAVWMTLGFFETDKEGDLANPPVEAGGSDLERHRAFYMIDRSIPVGYENGHDHNTEDVFRVKRYIE